eukprot:781834-Alexandrium_andersonii.AAC.1
MQASVHMRACMSGRLIVAMLVCHARVLDASALVLQECAHHLPYSHDALCTCVSTCTGEWSCMCGAACVGAWVRGWVRA